MNMPTPLPDSKKSFRHAGLLLAAALLLGGQLHTARAADAVTVDPAIVTKARAVRSDLVAARNGVDGNSAIAQIGRTFVGLVGLPFGIAKSVASGLFETLKGVTPKTNGGN